MPSRTAHQRPTKDTAMPPFPTRPEQILAYPSPPYEDTDWHQALARGDSDAARDAFVRALRTGEPRTCLEYDIPELYRRRLDGFKIGYQGGHQLDPDQVVNQHYVGVYGIEHTFEGEIDWLFDPTADWGENRTREWQVQLNRHYQWIPLADRYRETNDPKYARAFERELRSWVRQCPRPDDDGMGLPGTWRLIEVGIRAGWSWPYAFETFRRSEHVSDEAIWMMVCALHEHGMHLLLWPTKRNFKTMESNGLTHVGAMFPELRLARTFLVTGIDRVCAELERQVYPDGLQDELAPSYGVVALSNMYSAVRIAQRHEAFGTEVPRRAVDRLADMVAALCGIADPEAKLPPIHDSPAHDVTSWHEDFRAWLKDDARFVRKPWQTQGTAHLPWGGWTVLRRADRYALFDAGPWGTGHQHADALQLLTYAHGRWLCIDPGKPLYNTSALTRHMRSSAGHNVVLMDGAHHGPAPRELTAPRPYPVAVHEAAGVWVVAAKRRAVTVDVEAPAHFRHERVVLDVDGLGWVVLDRLEPEDEAAHAWEWLWHTRADRVEVDEAARAGFACYEGGPGLWIQPIGVEGAPLTLAVATGQTEPAVRGWRSEGAGDTPMPAPTLLARHDAVAGRVALLTLLVPTPSEAVPAVRVRERRMKDAAARIALDVEGREFAFEFAGADEIETVACTLPDVGEVRVALETHAYG
ncbi:MAG: alginate lyase family protein [Phycisphaeraceae bacterium]